MKTLFVEIFSSPDGNQKAAVPLETLVTLFAYKYCKKPIAVVLVSVQASDESFEINLNGLEYTWGVAEKPPENLCTLPSIVCHEDSTCIAGICAVVRQICKSMDPTHPLLGFKQSCLYACAEVSMWTKFCEIDAIRSAKSVLNTKEPIVPVDILRFEKHLQQPVRAHNIQKVKQDQLKSAGGSKCTIPDARLQLAADLRHEFAEGTTMSIADLILFPCFHVILRTLSGPGLEETIPLTYAWYTGLLRNREIASAVELICSVEQPFAKSHAVDYVVPTVPDESLYKSDPKRYKPRHKIFTRQEDIEESLEIVGHIEWDMIESTIIGGDLDFDWGAVPWDAQPTGGDLPERRAARKGQQLEGMSRAVLAIARHGDVIVDFCAGSGHLGLILAHHLPRCMVILLENKEESLNRARDRAQKLHLTNIYFCQSNVDYFKGEFTIGVSLHACGVATDLVIETSLRRNAAFVCCPCCYGSVQPNHMVQYPRSDLLRNILTERQYLVLGHAADQTHEGDAKTEQGRRCMDVIDADRATRAQQAGYGVRLAKIHPFTCTPKNNLLVGVPADR